MNCTNITTFILKGQQYYLHDCVVKDLPIFQELKKSDKLETIPYEHNISQDEIQYVFNVINNWKNDDDKLDLKNIINIYQFMKFLNIEIDKIDTFCKENLKTIDFTESVKYCIRNNYSYDVFEMVCKYCDKKDVMDIDAIKNYEVDYNVKFLIAKTKIITIIGNRSDCNVYYAKLIGCSSKCFETRMSHTKIEYIKKIYNKMLKTKNVKVVYEKHQFKGFFVNGKQVELCGNIDLPSGDGYIGIDLYDTIVNHISIVLLDKVDVEAEEVEEDGGCISEIVFSKCRNHWANSENCDGCERSCSDEDFHSDDTCTHSF